MTDTFKFVLSTGILVATFLLVLLGIVLVGGRLDAIESALVTEVAPVASPSATIVVPEVTTAPVKKVVVPVSTSVQVSPTVTK